MNFQENDNPLQINAALFKDNGGCGYVLKPEILRNPSLKFDPNNPNTMTNKVMFYIKIISAQNLMIDGKDISDPYVTVKIYGVPSDRAEKKTKYVKDNGFNPVWNEDFQFQINCPELAFVKFNVLDEDVGLDDELGYYVIKFDCIRKGFLFCLFLNFCSPQDSKYF